MKAKYSVYNQVLSLNPKALLNAHASKGWQKLAGAIFLQSAIQLNNRFVGKQGIAQYNPFIRSFDDSLLINNTSSLVQSVFINRYSSVWGLDYVQTFTGGKTLLNYGIDARENTEHFVRSRLNLSHHVTCTFGVKKGIKNFHSQFLENRNYNIAYQSEEPGLSLLLMSNKIRIQTSYKYDARQNAKLLGDEKAIANSMNVEMKYNIPGSGALSLKSTFTSIHYTGEMNSGVAYTMLDGLQNGKNWLWQASFNRRISKSIEMNLEYEGRKPGTNPVIHTGRASVRAIF